MSRLIFRCNGNKISGLGHVVRCLELGKDLAKMGVFSVFVGDFEASALEMIQAAGFRAEATSSKALDFLQLFDPSRDLFLFDSYDFDQRFFDQVEAEVRKWGAFDDYGLATYTGASFVVNFRVGAEVLYEYNEASHRFLGFKYFPVDESISSGSRTRGAHPENILVCLGGSDYFRIGEKLCEELQAFYPGAQIVFITPHTWPEPLTGVVYSPLVPKMAPYLAPADLLVCGGGRLKYEALLNRLPCVSLAQSRGEADDSNVMADKGLILYAGSAESYTPGGLTDSLSALEIFVPRFNERVEAFIDRTEYWKMIEFIRELTRN